MSKGKLPPKLQLNTQTDEIVNAPTTVGEYAFTLEATDKSQPPQLAQQDFVVQVIAPLTIVWKEGPRVEGNAINGRVAVSNYTSDTFDLTVIIVAVNEIGRATALGYQKLDLASGLVDFEIPFGSTLPIGKYVVHADRGDSEQERDLPCAATDSAAAGSDAAVKLLAIAPLRVLR